MAEAAPAPNPTSFVTRMRLYALMMGSTLSIKTVRYAIPMLVPFICQELNFGDTDRANMLGAFFPGYMLTQIPSGPLIQKYGGKPLLLCVMLATGLYALLPTAARIRGLGALPMAAMLTIIGMCQGPMSPCHGQLQVQWVPKGIERTWALKFLGLSHTLCPMLAAVATPRLARTIGWRSVCYIYGGINVAYSLVWQLLVPARLSGAASQIATQATGPETVTEPKKVVEWAIFKQPAVVALMIFQWSADNTEFTLKSLGPTFFMESFGIGAVEMGKYMAIAQMVHIPATFMVGALENLLQMWGVGTLTIRKGMGILESGVQPTLRALPHPGAGRDLLRPRRHRGATPRLGRVDVLCRARRAGWRGP